jgi:hypothetical protein
MLHELYALLAKIFVKEIFNLDGLDSILDIVTHQHERPPSPFSQLYLPAIAGLITSVFIVCHVSCESCGFQRS